MGAEICVLGAGLIGLSIARELALRGARVRLFDPAPPARAASWAGAGMLAPYTEAIEDRALRELCIFSLDLYPDFVAALAEQTGFDPELRREGTLQLALDEASHAALSRRVAALQREGVAASMLDRSAVREMEPQLDGAFLGASFVLAEAQIDNRRLGRALLAACVRAGVRIEAEEGGVAIEADARRVRGLRTRRGFVAAETVINAAGAWAGVIDGVPDHVRVPVVPIKGQMVAVDTRGHLPLRRVVWTPLPYLVPRNDGRLLIGSTMERSGFDVRVTAGAVASLIERAAAAVPAIARMPLIETWAGLRPGTPDRSPLLGETALGGYVLAAGHERNGILLTPATARLIADAVENIASPIDLKPFAPQRFAPERRAAAANAGT